MVPLHNSANVAILIGNNFSSAIRPREVIAGNDDEPYAQKSILGWGTLCAAATDMSWLKVPPSPSSFQKNATMLNHQHKQTFWKS